MQLNQQAEELNITIKKNSESVFNLLSQKGKTIYFPKKGILSQAADAKGKKINATIGIAVEDDGSPMRLPSISNNLSLSPDSIFNYAPSYGRPDIREKWKLMMYEKNQSLKGKEISLPVVSLALTHGLSMVAYMFVDETDEIILPNLFWENYELIFTNAFGAKLDFFNFFKEGKLDLEDLNNKLTKGNIGKKVLLLNFPNNPAGYTPLVNEAKEITRIIHESAKKGNKLVVIIDDAYFGLVYEEGVEKESLFSWLSDLHENVLAVKLDGPTKEDYVWGFRVGFITYGIKNGNKELYSALESKTAGAIRGSISNAPNISQSLLLKAYTSPTYNEEKLKKYHLLKERYDEVKLILKDKKYGQFFIAIPFNSGYFMCIQLNKNIDPEKVRQILLQNYSTGVICSSNLLRLAFSSVAKKDLKELFENIYKACKDISEE